jgi:vacuolar-type H+-ATPase catalytic subunit A/Vma1
MRETSGRLEEIPGEEASTTYAGYLQQIQALTAQPDVKP